MSITFAQCSTVFLSRGIGVTGADLFLPKNHWNWANHHYPTTGGVTIVTVTKKKKKDNHSDAGDTTYTYKFKYNLEIDEENKKYLDLYSMSAQTLKKIWL